MNKYEDTKLLKEIDSVVKKLNDDVILSFMNVKAVSDLEDNMFFLFSDSRDQILEKIWKIRKIK